MAIEKTLTKDKTTPGTIRYKDTSTTDHPLAIYLTKEELKAEFGEIPETLKVEITKA